MDTRLKEEMEIENQDDYQETIRELKEYMETSGKSQVEVAKEIGRTGGAVSGFLSGKYKTPHAMIPDIKALLELNRKKSVSPTEPEYAETGVCRRIVNSIAYAHVRGVVSVIYGDAGVGKTSAVKEYVRRERLALLITARPDYSSITGVNELIAKQLGIKERVSRKITDEIISRMQGSRRVLIVDEAQHLTVKALDHLRCLSDESGTGIALVGNEKVYDKMRGDGSKELGQLFSRICMPEHVQTEDITYEDIESIFGRYAIGPDVMKLLLGISNSPYGLRGAVNVYINTVAVNKRIDAQGMVQMMRKMKIG